LCQSHAPAYALFSSSTSRPLRAPLFPYTTLFRSGSGLGGAWKVIVRNDNHNTFDHVARTLARVIPGVTVERGHEIANVIHTTGRDRKSTRLNSSHGSISYAVFCLKKKTIALTHRRALPRHFEVKYACE